MRYHNITKEDMLNGEGLRVVLWVAGCEHHCKGCHNPETWDVEGGIPFDEDTKNELFEALDKDYIEGITFSGGDPLHPCNVNMIVKLCMEIRYKFPDKDIWLYTGYSLEDDKPNVKKIVDCFISTHSVDKDGKSTSKQVRAVDIIIDGEFVEELKDNKLRWRGSSNQKIWHLLPNGDNVDISSVYDSDEKDDYSENYLSGEKCGCGC